MKNIKKKLAALSFVLLHPFLFSQQNKLNLDSTRFSQDVSIMLTNTTGINEKNIINFNNPINNSSMKKNLMASVKFNSNIVSDKDKTKLIMKLEDEKENTFFKNRRNIYSSLWAFVSLNYLYADLVGFMDKSKLLQYQTGVVDGLEMSPEFLTVAAGFMQIPLANVFLPQVIKNEKVLKWVQIASGTIMTLIQSGTLFMGKPSPYYVLFSAIEISATTYITINAARWKARSNKKQVILD